MGLLNVRSDEKWADEIHLLFKSAQESDVYDKIVEYLESKFSDALIVKKNQVLLLKIMAFIKDGKSSLGYSGSDADIVMYPHDQKGPNLKDLEKTIQRKGQYGLENWEGIYPTVIGQVVVSTRTGKLHLENMKAQYWRNMFPRSLIVFMAGPYREDYDIRFDRDMSAFDLVLAGFEDRENCKKNLERMCDVIGSHLRVKWSDNL